MDKKDIYEHLAKIYLDASQQGKKKSKPVAKFKKPLIYSSAAVLCLAVITLSVVVLQRRPINSETTLVIASDPLKINFNFDPAKKEIVDINLNKLNMSRFKTLKFFTRKMNYNDKINLRVEMTNAYKEKSEKYFNDIGHKWEGYAVNLSEFSKISDWTEMSRLSFIIEQWNSKDKNGVVYIDNVSLVR